MGLFKRKSYDQEFVDFYIQGNYNLAKQNMNKNWYKSWTIWFNLLLLLVEYLNQVNQVVPLPPNAMLVIAGLGNLLLRLKTTTSLK